MAVIFAPAGTFVERPSRSSHHELMVGRLEIRRQGRHVALTFCVVDRHQNPAQVALFLRVRAEIVAQCGRGLRMWLVRRSDSRLVSVWVLVDHQTCCNATTHKQCGLLPATETPCASGEVMRRTNRASNMTGPRQALTLCATTRPLRFCPLDFHDGVVPSRHS